MEKNSTLPENLILRGQGTAALLCLGLNTMFQKRICPPLTNQTKLSLLSH